MADAGQLRDERTAALGWARAPFGAGAPGGACSSPQSDSSGRTRV